MKKILLVTYDAYPHEGGKSTHIKYLIDGLTALGVECDVFSFNDASEIRNNIGKIFIQPCKLIGKDCYLYYRLQVGKDIFKEALRRKLSQNHYDMISAQDAVSGEVLNEILSENQNISLTMHTYFGLENGMDNGVLKAGNKYYERMMKEELEALQCAKAVIAVDERIEKHVEKIVNSLGDKVRCKVYCIQNFINTNIFKTCPKRKKGEPLKIICVRRLVEKNGVIYAVKAMKYCNKNIVLHIIGDGPEMKKIQECIKREGLEDRVVLHGSMKNEEVLQLYKACNAAIIPSVTVNGLQEATSISALEAMACSMPTVVSAIGGLKLLVRDGVTGLLAEERNEKEIGKKLQWIYDNEEEACRMGVNAKKFVEKHHSHISAAKHYLDVFLG